MHSIVDNIKIEQALMPQVIQGSALNSGDIDMLGAENLSVVLLVGDMSDVLSGSVKVDVKIQHADDDGSGVPDTYVDCDDEDVLNASGLTAGVFLSVDEAAKEQSRHVIEYRGAKRFVKVTATPTGLSTGGEIAILSLKGGLNQKPTDNS